MKFFIDTADLDEIAEAKSWGCLAGVTTNPSLYARTGGKLADFEPHMLKIAELCEGLPVSAESTATTAEGMIEEGRRLAGLAPNIVVKLPVCEAGLAATHALAAEGVRTCIQNYDWTGKNVDDQVEIITASVRTPNHVTQAALLGADIATVPFAALKKCLQHPLTDRGLASFEADWKKVVEQA